MTKKTRVLVTIKKDVLDPASVALKKTLERHGHNNIADVRIGKVIDISFTDRHDITESMPALVEVAKTILSNPIMEDFTISIVDEGQHDH